MTAPLTGLYTMNNLSLSLSLTQRVCEFNNTVNREFIKAVHFCENFNTLIEFLVYTTFANFTLYSRILTNNSTPEYNVTLYNKCTITIPHIYNDLTSTERLRQYSSCYHGDQ